MNKCIVSLAAAGLAAPSLFGLINLGEGRIDLKVDGSAYYDTHIRA